MRRGVIVLATVLIFAALVGAMQALRGAGNTSNTSNTQRLASGSDSTATMTAQATAVTTATDIPTSTSSPGSTGNPASPTPSATATSVPLQADIRVTQNQDMRPTCVDDTSPYAVVLFNAGNVAANWHVSILGVAPEVTEMASGGLSARTQPLIGPPSGFPYWATATPTGGSVAPGQSASFVINPLWSMPCGGTTYLASVQLSFPSGGSQADIPLTYAGTGPARYSNVVLTSGSLNLTEACPASGSAAAPFTFAFKNIGNYKAYSVVDSFQDKIGLHYWATISSITISPQEPDTHWLYPGETWTATIAPTTYAKCGATYHIYIETLTAQGTDQTITITDTIG